MHDIIRVSRAQPTPCTCPETLTPRPFFPRLLFDGAETLGDRERMRLFEEDGNENAPVPGLDVESHYRQPTRFVERIKCCRTEIQTFGIQDGDRWPKLAGRAAIMVSRAADEHQPRFSSSSFATSP